jgi:plasmid stability protein
MSAIGEEEKMSSRKLLKLPPSLMTRLTRVSAQHKEEANEIVRRGLTAELDRMDAEASIESVRLEKLRKLAAAHGGDVGAVLDQMLSQMVEPELQLAVGGK